MFEHSSEPLLPFNKFMHRMARRIGTLLVLIGFSLCVGAAGYAITEHMSWIDAFYNAALILSGMGPANILQTNSGKIFASVYALYSGLFVIVAMGFLLPPIFHRVLHKFHGKK